MSDQADGRRHFLGKPEVKSEPHYAVGVTPPSVVYAAALGRIYDGPTLRLFIEEKIVASLTEQFLKENTQEILGSLNMQAITNALFLRVADQIAKRIKIE